ncbi:MAG: galactose-1-epimerase, partial [Xylanibacter rarus]
LNCHRWLPADVTDIPLGSIEPVEGTPMDFLQAKALGRDIGADFSNMRTGKGYNHFFFVDGWNGDGRLRLVAVLDDDESRRRLSVYSTQCGAMLYTGNWLADNLPVGKSGRRYADHDGVAIECQGAPDAPNHPSLPCQVLMPGETYRHVIKYAFSINC